MDYWNTIIQLSVWVLTVVEYLKNLLKISGTATRIVAFVVSILIAFFYAMTSPAQETLWQIILYGIGAAVIAGGGKDFLKKVLQFVGADIE